MQENNREIMRILRDITCRRRETLKWIAEKKFWKFYFPRMSGPTIKALQTEFNAGLADFGSRGWYLTPLGLTVQAALEQKSEHGASDTGRIEAVREDAVW